MSDIYGGQDPRDIPIYSFPEAAHYLRLPYSTLRSWVVGRDYPVRAGTARFEPVIRLSDPTAPALSFTNLVEAHVLRGARRDHGIAIRKVRAAVAYVRQRMGVDRPLAHVQFETDGVDLFVEKMGRLVNASDSQQQTLLEEMRGHLRRIERDAEGGLARLFLFTRGRGLDQPRVVVADPRVQFGRPVLAGTGVPTTILLGRYLAGESMDELAADYQCDRLMIEEAIRCEHRQAA